MRVLVSGPRGGIGCRLVAALTARGDEVVGLSRNPVPGGIAWSPLDGELDPVALEGFDAVVHLAGETIEGRWTKAHKERIRASRVVSTSLLASALARLDSPPEVLVNASAVGIYGNRPGETLDEGSEPGVGFLAEVCVDWERATRAAGTAGIRVALARTGMVLDGTTGALPPLIRLTRFFLGGRIGSGRQMWSWIDIADEVAALIHLIDTQVEGPVNLTSPHPVAQADFAGALRRVVGRAFGVPTPGWAIGLALGEMGRALLLSDSAVEPTVLTESGFAFTRPDLSEALEAELARVGVPSPC